MTIHGSCLCGGVRFEVDADAVTGPFEICHCNRCRKVSGSIGLPQIMVRADGYRMTAGADLVDSYAAPVLSAPPAYHALFCRRCGSPLPEPDPAEPQLEIPAGLLDDDPGVTPDKHIFVELLPAWDRIADTLPRYTIVELARERFGRELPADYRLPTHYEALDRRDDGD